MDRLIVYRIIAGLIKAQLNCPNCTATRSADGQSVLFTISNYPSFPNGVESDVIVSYPFTWLSLSNINGKVAVTPSRVSSANVRFWQGAVGSPFLHAHVFNSGHPCWGHRNQDLTTVQEIIKHLILTLRCANIGKYSLNGHLATRDFGNNADEAYENAKKQAARVDAIFRLSPVDSIELSQWIDGQFRLRIGMLKWQ
ncbi:MAG: hypothetical protein FWH03_00710 [Firmicutes bacterium]|nr:hypothetical protein [Bacillota bacterium]